MIPEIDFIKKTFSIYNETIFKGELPIPRFNLTRARTFRGKLVYRIRRKLIKTEFYDYEMRFSINFNLSQTEWEDVVIHEMIHLYIAAKKIKDNSSHGPVFRQIMEDINKVYSRNIKVSSKSTINEAAEKNPDRRVKGHFICLARMNDGRLGVAPVAKSRIFSLWDAFQNFNGVRSLRWIGSTDVWFNHVPHVQTPKFYILNEDDIRIHLKGARHVERTGNRIKVLNRHCSPDELLP